MLFQVYNSVTLALVCVTQCSAREARSPPAILHYCSLMDCNPSAVLFVSVTYLFHNWQHVRLHPLPLCSLQQLLECNKCRNSYHPECLGPNYPTKPTKKKKVWVSTHMTPLQRERSWSSWARTAWNRDPLDWGCPCNYFVVSLPGKAIPGKRSAWETDCIWGLLKWDKIL